MDIGDQQRVIIVEPINVEEIALAGPEVMIGMGVDAPNGGAPGGDELTASRDGAPETRA